MKCYYLSLFILSDYFIGALTPILVILISEAIVVISTLNSMRFTTMSQKKRFAKSEPFFFSLKNFIQRQIRYLNHCAYNKDKKYEP